MSETTRVVIGSDTKGDYAFLLPLTCMFWRDIVGYEPVVMLVGTPGEWRQKAGAVVDALVNFVDVRYVGRAVGYPDHTTAQQCRSHVGALSDLKDDVWIMPSDADLWPLQREFYHQHEGQKQPNGLTWKAVSYYSNGDHFMGKEETLRRLRENKPMQTIPMCHLVMRVGDWRAIYGTIPGDIAGSIKQTLDAGEFLKRDGFALWMSDQTVMTTALVQQQWFPQQVKFIERRGHPPVDRLDRGHPADWASFDPSKWTDAHLLRAPWEPNQWQALMKIISAKLPERVASARAFHSNYVEGV